MLKHKFRKYPIRTREGDTPGTISGKARRTHVRIPDDRKEGIISMCEIAMSDIRKQYLRLRLMGRPEKEALKRVGKITIRFNFQSEDDLFWAEFNSPTFPEIYGEKPEKCSVCSKKTKLLYPIKDYLWKKKTTWCCPVCNAKYCTMPVAKRRNK